MKKYILIATIATILVAFLFIYALFNTTQKRTQLKMGTYVQITLNGPAWTGFDKIFNRAFLAIDKVENIASTFDKNSELSAINKNASEYPVRVGEELYNLIEEALDISKNTEGAFDITVAPLVELWGFYKMQNVFPPENKIKEALEAVGYDNVILDKNNKTIFLKKKGVRMDLAAIAKGYAVDKAAQAIKQCGINSAVINAGGDIYCLGRKTIFQKWSVGIQDPAQKGNIIKRIYLEDKAVATSGGYEKFFVYGGKRYCHIVDPRTGFAVQGFSSATVIADNCTLADALATAMCVLGKGRLEKIKEKYNVEIIMTATN